MKDRGEVLSGAWWICDGGENFGLNCSAQADTEA